MNLTPKHLRLFREHFALAQKQAASLLNRDRAYWLRLEGGIDPITPVISRRVCRWAQRLGEALTRKAQWCHICHRNITKARVRGSKRCPYCGSNIDRSMKRRIVEVLPIRA